jgi:tetratricopeptide (TPR) repeat protein
MAFPLTLMRIVESFEALLRENGWLWPNFVRASGYVFIIATQGIALYFSGSRGPWLGWATSLVLIWLGLSLIWRKRWLTISGVSIALLAGVFLVVLNLPSGPLEGLRNRPEFGRLGQLLDAESRTGRVRTLIWSGASELVQPHKPLEFPDGRKDAYNAIRPLIGYGPESMYVAYNPFYPPELTQVEKRNASPDRSHNETWDSLVITGVLGLIAYLALFGSVIYFGLKWLGMVRGVKQRNLYLVLYLFGGLSSSVLFIWWKGLTYLGVALPFGMILGVMVYLILVSLFGRLEAPAGEGERLRAYLLLGLLAAVVAHFMEINFGIAIAVTRTYFWSYSTLILLVGYVLPFREEFQIAGEESSISGSENRQLPSNARRARESRQRDRRAASSSAQKRRQGTASRSKARSEAGFLRKSWSRWLQEALIVAFIVGILLTTLGFDLISNASRKSSAMGLIWASLTALPGSGSRSSPGILMLFLTAWLIGAALLVSESVRYLPEIFSSTENAPDRTSTWLKMIGTALAVSLLLGLIFWLWHATSLVNLTRSPATNLQQVLAQVGSSEGLLTNFYVYLFIMTFALAFVLPVGWPRHSTRLTAASAVISLGAFVVTFALASFTNLRIIQADIAFKTGDLFANPENWPVAITIYNHANKLAPNEDYYYLFLGRAYLEYAKSLQDPEEREKLIAQAADDLKKAQVINPLNTDHTANLARLYSLWSTYTTDPSLREQRAMESDEFFSKAVILSPKNARLWDEWAVHKQNILKDPEAGFENLQRALEIDPYYDWTYGLLGDYYARSITEASNSDSKVKQEILVLASDYYSKALSLSDESSVQLRYSYAIGMAGIQAQLENYDQATTAYIQALDIWPDNPEAWKVNIILARIYAQKGDAYLALGYAQKALVSAPEDQREGIQNLIAQLGGQP